VRDTEVKATEEVAVPAGAAINPWYPYRIRQDKICWHILLNLTDVRYNFVITKL
jgi:hypothetical protein